MPIPLMLSNQESAFRERKKTLRNSIDTPVEDCWHTQYNFLYIFKIENKTRANVKHFSKVRIEGILLCLTPIAE
jgi:hypothetical protein